MPAPTGDSNSSHWACRLTADVNSDGKPDLIVANFDSSTVSMLLNTTVPGAATPSFGAQQTFATGFGRISSGLILQSGQHANGGSHVTRV